VEVIEVELYNAHVLFGEAMGGGEEGKDESRDDSDGEETDNEDGTQDKYIEPVEHSEV
jgi:hypothetical protein